MRDAVGGEGVGRGLRRGADAGDRGGVGVRVRPRALPAGGCLGLSAVGPPCEERAFAEADQCTLRSGRGAVALATAPQAGLRWDASRVIGLWRASALYGVLAD